MRGPISSLSRKANTTSGQPERVSILWEPVCRFTTHPLRWSAAKTRFARSCGFERDVEELTARFPLFEPISNHPKG